MADQIGPWTLDGLDAFGDLDSLPFSLDSAIWQTATIHDAAIEIAVAVDMDGDGCFVREASAAVPVLVVAEMVGGIILGDFLAVSIGVVVTPGGEIRGEQWQRQDDAPAVWAPQAAAAGIWTQQTTGSATWRGQ